MEQIAIFCDIDDFCKDYEEYCTHSLLMDKNEVVPKTKMALSEIMTIVIMYHLSGYRTFKHYYTRHVMKYQKQDFPTLVSYNRFVEIIRYAFVPLLLYTIKGRFGKCSGISVCVQETLANKSEEISGKFSYKLESWRKMDIMRHFITFSHSFFDFGSTEGRTFIQLFRKWNWHSKELFVCIISTQ